MQQNNEKAQQVTNWKHDRDTGKPRVSRRGDGRIGGRVQRGSGNGWGAYSRAFGLPALNRMRSLDATLIRLAAAIQAGLNVDFHNDGYIRLRVTRPTKPKSARPKCGAKTRSGAACKATVCLKRDGSAAKRCRLHGGCSTGPRTSEGRAAIAESNRRRKVAREAREIATDATATA